MKPGERDTFIEKLIQDEWLAENLRYAAVVRKREKGPDISLDDYLAARTKKKK